MCQSECVDVGVRMFVFMCVCKIVCVYVCVCDGIDVCVCVCRYTHITNNYTSYSQSTISI